MSGQEKKKSQFQAANNKEKLAQKALL